jgi:hypothetical protein
MKPLSPTNHSSSVEQSDKPDLVPDSTSHFYGAGTKISLWLLLNTDGKIIHRLKVCHHGGRPGTIQD